MKRPNTISDQQWADLQRRAQQANPGPFDPQTVKKRKASEQQRRNASKS